MKTIKLLIISFLFFITGKTFADDFIRNLPKPEMVKVLTPDKFPNSDAVIILKEQSYQVQFNNFTVKGGEIFGPASSYSKIMIVKLFNQHAVDRYGSFEFEYYEKFGDELENGFTARARVMKENGDIEVLDEDEIKNIVSQKDKHGEPLTRKVLFKIPNLAPGDVVQIEYQYDDVLAFSSSDVFYYNDVDYVLYSNLYLTQLFDTNFKIYSAPEYKIGNPQVQQLSNKALSGKTYFWSVKNLPPIPKETFSKPFEETSMFTAFVLYDSKEENDMKLWGNLAHKFYDNYIDKGIISKKQCKELGLPELAKSDSINFEKVDQLYSSIKKYFTLEKFDWLFPINDDIDELFDTKKGDASDLSIAMFKILNNWGQNAKIVWISDRRDGNFDPNVPTTSWFNRIGVLVNINGKEKVYDFDRCIPANYKTPWFLSGINAMVIDKDSYQIKTLPNFDDMKNNFIFENHKLTFTENFYLNDTVNVVYEGSKAETYRDELYDLEEDEIKDAVKQKYSSTCFKEINNLFINNYNDEGKIEFDLSGSSAIQPEVLDSFLVLKLKSSVIKEFKDLVFTNFRHNDYCFETPFCLKADWEIELPKGFKLKESLPAKTLLSPVSAFTQIDYKFDSNKLKISMTMSFRERIIPANKCSDFMGFLDRTIKAIEKDIVLKKI